MTNYDDIIDLPHYVSKKRPQMSISDRAAQFSPFAALVGFDDEIAETNRQTVELALLDENYLNELDEKLQYVDLHIAENPPVSLTYFVADSVKEGGNYVSVKGRIKQIDKANREICFTDKQKVKIDCIVEFNIE